MKLGIILNTNASETAYNALRLANTARAAGHDVSIFLLGSGVEVESAADRPFDVPAVLAQFMQGGGNMYACGTCLEARGQRGAACSVSTMARLLEIIIGSDRVVTFG